MPRLMMLDASALVKRYVVESGSDTMNRLFDSVDARRMSCLEPIRKVICVL